MANTRPKLGFIGGIKRGANVLLVGAGVGGIACLFSPIAIPLAVALGVGAVGASVVALKTGKK